MTPINNYTQEELTKELQKAKEEYASYQRQNLNLNLTRGKPSPSQLDLSNDLLKQMPETTASWTEFLNAKDCSPCSWG